MVTDITDKSFWHRVPFLTPWAHLARWDRPIGMWLTLWPALWSLFLAPSYRILAFQQQVYFVLLFVAGAVLMRGAGCTINDIWDRRLDVKVARTKTRPLASGKISLAGAVVFLILQLALAALILFQLSPQAIGIGLVAVPLVAIYPLMKRVTFLPQVVLAIVFNAGALIAWAAMENNLSILPFLIYAAAFFWTMAYDTVYAHLDSADDAMIGVKSTALLWGPDSKTWIFWFWLASLVCFFGALVLAHVPWPGLLAFALAAVVMITAHAYWNPLNLRYTLGLFRLQARIGLLLGLAALSPLLF